MSASKPRIIIAGQVPPPSGGQNIMIQNAIAQFSQSPDCETVHLPFFFTPEVGDARKGSSKKVFELVRVVMRLLRIRAAGRIDMLLFPTGGPQTIPMIRDICLLPWILLCSRRVILHFHAAGIAEVSTKGRQRLISRLVCWLYRKAFAAVVMTEFNRRDPAMVGITRIRVVPHRIPDQFVPSLVRRNDSTEIQLLYVGHLCRDKGTPQLIEAAASLMARYPDLRLDLVGECLPPFDQEQLASLLDRLDLRQHVVARGLLTGRMKAEAFGNADLFVFPSIAPYESFGLVLVEAMSWKLPIVASRWRGNADVLTPNAGGIIFAPTTSLADDIAAALEEAIRQKHRWEEWGLQNRLIFEQRYKEVPGNQWLVKPVLSLLDQT